MLGWTSFSHIRHRQNNIATLQRFAEITDGPVVASFYLRKDGPVPAARAESVSRAARAGTANSTEPFHASHRVLPPELRQRTGRRSCASRSRAGGRVVRHGLGWLLALDCGGASRSGVRPRPLRRQPDLTCRRRAMAPPSAAKTRRRERDKSAQVPCIDRPASVDDGDEVRVEESMTVGA